MSGNILQFPLRIGLAEDANPKAPPVSSLKRGHDIRWVKDGVIGKSYAFSERATLPEAAIPQRFIVRDDELSVTDGQRLFTRQPDGEWVDSDEVCEAALEWETLLDDERGIATSDMVVIGDSVVHAWVTGDPTRKPEATPVPDDTGSGFVQVLDATTYQPLMRPVRLTGGPNARIVHVRLQFATSTLAFIFFSTDDGDVRYVAVDLSTLTVTASAVLANDLRNDSYFGRFDCLFLASGDLFFTSERSYNTLISARYTRSGTTLAYAAAIDNLRQRIVSIAAAEDPVSGRVGVIYCLTDGSNNYSVEFLTVNSSTMSTVVAPVTLQSAFFASQVDIYKVSFGRFGVAFSGTEELDAPVRLPALMTMQVAIASGSTFTTTVERSMGLALLSRAFQLAGKRHIFAVDSRYGERDGSGDLLALVPSVSSYLLGIDDGASSELYPPHRFVGKIDHDIAGIFQVGVLPRVGVVGDTTVLGMTPFQATAAPASFNWRSGLRIARATVDLALMKDPFRSVMMGPETYINGSRLSAWDGGLVFDYGMRAPFLATVASGGSETGDIPLGDYIYQVNANYRSRVGVLHRSPMSIAYVTPAIGSTYLFLIPNSIDGKQRVSTGFGVDGPNAAAFDIFRSQANLPNLHQLTYAPRYNTLLNMPNARVLQFVDTSADDDITANFGGSDDPPVPAVPLATRPQPYIATGELEDVQPPGVATMCFHLGRILTLTGGGELWFTKDMVENPSYAPGFNPSFVRLFEKRPTAIVSFVDRVIIFFERGAKFMVGDGPTVAGTDDRFSSPQAIPGDVGTTNPKSVVVAPVGVFFQATTGEIYLFDGGAMQWVGKEIRDVLAVYPTITSAVHVAEQREVRFTCHGTVDVPNPPDSENPFSTLTLGIILVYDYQRQTWMTRSTPEDAPANDAIMCGGVYHLATNEGVWKEVVGSYFDIEGAFRPSTVVLNPIAPNGPASWHRVKRVALLGQSLSPHDLTVAIARDFAETTEQSRTWISGSDVTALGPLERMQLALAHQKAQAIEVHISDAAPTGELEIENPLGSGEGLRLEGVAFLVQSKQGLARITKSRRG